MARIGTFDVGPENGLFGAVDKDEFNNWGSAYFTCEESAADYATWANMFKRGETMADFETWLKWRKR